jgi:hypothetical protein
MKINHKATVKNNYPTGPDTERPGILRRKVSMSAPRRVILIRKADMNKWKKYEIEKEIIQKKNLTPEQYEKEIRKLCERFGL